ncbi:hypothetical protein [Teredinibacter franksiae]|uniref:hypothetical protein n=1 Tax=Teredinibacter franksiae TaxID=2761453 RepID=UPI0016276305|nr:hypothetical protein [Teredinibacter franksiae]
MYLYTQYTLPLALRLTLICLTCSLIGCGDTAPNSPLGAATNACEDKWLVCESFESSSDLADWQPSNIENIQLSHKYAIDGKRSLEFKATGGGYNASFIRKNLANIPQLQQSLYGRLWLYLDESNKLSGDFTFIQAAGQPKPGTGAPDNTRVMYRARIDGRHDHFMANYETQIDTDGDSISDWHTDCWKHPNADGAAEPPTEYKIPHNQWSCVQWEYHVENNEMRYWLNGQALSDIQVNGAGDGCIGSDQQGAWTAPNAFDEIKLGIEQYHTWVKPRTLYMDKIAINDSPIPCD